MLKLVLKKIGINVFNSLVCIGLLWCFTHYGRGWFLNCIAFLLLTLFRLPRLEGGIKIK